MLDTVLFVWFGLLRLILSFLHIVYSGLQYFDVAWALFKRKIEYLYQSRYLNPELYVSRFVTKLEKCPSHFAVISGTEKISFEEFSNLVIWCIAAGISFISFYDYTGYLKSNQELYYKYLIGKAKLNPNCVVFNLKMFSNKNGVKKNGIAKKIHVNIFSLEDGKPLFVKLVGNICERALSDKLETTEIDEIFIDKEMHHLLEFDDPELALVCGRICGTFGFLPWHIRLTEFIQVPSIRNIRASDFTSILKKYSSCNQRFGR